MPYRPHRRGRADQTIKENGETVTGNDNRAMHAGAESHLTLYHRAC